MLKCMYYLLKCTVKANFTSCTVPAQSFGTRERTLCKMVISWQSQKLNFEWRTTNFFLEEAIEVGYFLIFF